MESKHDHSVEVMKTDLNTAVEEIETSLVPVRKTLASLNVHGQRLVGRVFGIKSLFEENLEEEMELLSSSVMSPRTRHVNQKPTLTYLKFRFFHFFSGLNDFDSQLDSNSTAKLN